MWVSFWELLKIDDYLIVLYEGYLIYYIKEPLKNILHKSKEELIIKENEIETVKLPFSFYNYFKDEYSEKNILVIILQTNLLIF